MSSVRSIKFSKNASFMAMAENEDFVHIYDVSSDFKHSQVIDFFGEISGIEFSPDSEILTIGCAGIDSGGIFQFENSPSNRYYLNNL